MMGNVTIMTYDTCAQMRLALYQDIAVDHVGLCKKCTITNSDTAIVFTFNGIRTYTARILPEQLAEIETFYECFGNEPTHSIEDAVELITMLGNLDQTEEERLDSFGKYLELYDTNVRYCFSMRFAIYLEKEQNVVEYSAYLRSPEDLTIPDAPKAYIKYIIDAYGTLDEPYYRTKEVTYYDANDNIIDDFFMFDDYARKEERQLSAEEIEVTKAMYPYDYSYRACLEGEQIWTEYENWYRKVKIDELITEL